MWISRKAVMACMTAAAALATGSMASAATTVSLWHPWGGPNAKLFTDMVKQFNSEHRDIRVVPQFVEVTSIDQKVLLAVAAGSGPDVAWGFPAFLARSGSFIVDLSPFVQQERGGMSDVLPRYWESARYKGQVLGFPIEANGSAIAYNLDLLASAGVAPPPDNWNWDAFVETAKRLTLDKNGDGKVDQYGWSGFIDLGDPWSFLPYLWQAGGNLFDDDYSPKVCKLKDKEAAEALHYVTNLGNKWGVTLPGLSSGSIITKKAAMETAGAWQMSDWANAKGLRVDATLLPRHRTEANILLIAHLYLLRKKPAVQKAAWTFIKWFCSPENNARWAVNTGYLPIRKKAMTSEQYTAFVKRMPPARAFLAGMDAARPRPFWLPTWKRLGQALGKQIGNALQRKASPEQALARAADEMTKILATGRK